MNEWTQYAGNGAVPCPHGVAVELRSEDGATVAGLAGALNWADPGAEWPGCRPVAWRAARERVARRVACNGLIDMGRTGKR